MTWGFEDSGPRTGSFNMRRDGELAELLARGEIPPTLRLYAWQPFALSYGYHQREEEFDQAKLSAAGFDLVQRPTGGKAIFHGEELTYCAVMPLDGRSPREIYELLNTGLLAGVRALGIDAHLAKQNESLAGSFGNPEMAACFSSSARSEIHVGARKILGSAQRKMGAVVLQHGSFLLGPAHRRIAEFIVPAGDTRGQAVLEKLDAGATDAASVLGRRVSYAEAARAIRRGFEEALGAEFAGVAQELTVHS